MNRDEAVTRAEAWIREQHGADRMAVLTEHVKLIRGDWYVPYDLTDPDDALVPLPAVEVPDDGGPLRRHVPSDGWSTGVPESWPAPTAAGVYVDQEWDAETFAHVDVPIGAILGWQRKDHPEQFRRNPKYVHGPAWRGEPLPYTPADKAFGYYRCGWLNTAKEVAALLDVQLYLPLTSDGRLANAGSAESSCLAAHTSPAYLPPGTHAWLEKTARQVLTDVPVDEIWINPGMTPESRMPREPLLRALDRHPGPAVPPQTGHRGFPPDLADALDRARSAGFELGGRQWEELREVRAWKQGGRRGPRPPAAQAFWDAEGGRYWDEPTFSATAPPGPTHHRWHSVVGAYLGFALCDRVSGTNRGLTAGLLHATDLLVRKAAGWAPDLAATGLPLRPAGWLDRWSAPGGPQVKETVGLLGAVASAARPQLGGYWVDDVSPVFELLLRPGRGELTAVLRELGAFPHIVAMREQDTPLAEQLAGLGTPWERALLVVVKLGHRPFDALRVPLDDLTLMTVGALLGARHGIRAFPGNWLEDLPDRHLVECLATTAHRAFDPALLPDPTRLADHPGLPPITPAMRAEAAKTPGGWLYCADPDVDPRHIDGVPTPTLLGAYKIGPDGAFTGETWVNEDYRPSPRRRGLPRPENAFEEVLAFVAAEWLPYEAAVRAALDHEFLIGLAPDGNLAVLVAPTGARVLPAYSAPRHVPEGTPARPMSLRSLLTVLPGVTVLVNPGGSLGIDLVGDQVVANA
ncbi:hypothetical protein L6E12_29235 [Actinokineospora sp. PR83]|uniref:hypothetical protein n=1 Tax=Actinokineospora sp. PR83 TaxID=2884908 RepID=UPI001F2B636E|nr:hypothetical protein [Actinokineospora sp. PR83]MCG8919861.1 hypothetical protein [Actinokineospora sp. PR83]